VDLGGIARYDPSDLISFSGSLRKSLLPPSGFSNQSLVRMKWIPAELTPALVPAYTNLIHFNVEDLLQLSPVLLHLIDPVPL
jgi:hypothetical protein